MASNTLTLRIISPDRVVLNDTEVDQVSATAVDGGLSILPGHEPLVTALAVDVLTYKKGNKEESAAIIGGIMEVSKNEVTILTDAAELDAEIDEARASQAKARAEAEKTQKTDKLDVYVSEMALSRAIARLKAAELSKRRRRDI